MDEFDPAPEPDRQRWQAGTDTFGRVYDVLLGTTAPTPYAEIAETADCSPNAAKKHLDRLTEMDIARADTDGQPARYARNDAYFEWQEASRIAREHSVDDIVERVHELETKRSAYEERFDATDPSGVSAFDADGHDAVHERMAAIGDWQGIVREIRLYELARQITQNDGHLIPA
ncbi:MULTISPECIES: DUF7342 family protein [Halomicrobium]|uniref:Sugar-specific transcriptional regulator TrmB n=2 Tax=Halomicrobium mukohataei TaxID=57705 RepID=C7P3C5_HALMD|nr:MULTISPECIES: helix-turn-helix transcriptional regulator [Halomicrobium]ACV47597.1 conserved hypothetical protein [Halomicrobium mukohataei DSM 12286]QCD66059.1 helix-turn-helix transcriptional regulator [Halomicrobium mukohataei]QFR20864.1 sugar-specific transcriptional regulator TrmB [Halomicrobium sp. ZPS1]